MVENNFNLDDKSYFFKISFGKSTSQNYQKAIKLLMTFPRYTLISNGAKSNSTFLTQDEVKQYLEKIFKLWSIISSWKSSEFIIDGKIGKSIIENLYAVFRCYEIYSKSVLKESYCTDFGWGCKLISQISLAKPGTFYYNPSKNIGSILEIL